MQIVIVGAGGHGKVVLDILRAHRRCNPVGFIDSDPGLAGKSVGGLPVLGPPNILRKLRQQKVSGALVAIGENRTRHRFQALLREQGFKLINAVHPSATVSSGVRLGENVVVAAGVVLGVECLVGDGTIVNTSAVIDHECEIGPAVHVCPGAHLAGRVRVGQGAFIGLGANIIQCLTIGSFATIGAGAVVLRDVPAGATAVGVPARLIGSESAPSSKPAVAPA